MQILYNDDTGHHAEINFHTTFIIRPNKEEMDKCYSIQDYAIRIWTNLIIQMTTDVVDRIIEELEEWEKFNNE